MTKQNLTCWLPEHLTDIHLWFNGYKPTFNENKPISQEWQKIDSDKIRIPDKKVNLC